MVKKYVIGLGLLSLLISCSKTEYIRVDNGLVYENKFDTIFVDVDSIENKNIINDTTFSANFYKNVKTKVEITGKLKKLLLTEYVKMEVYYSKLNNGSDYSNFNYYNHAQHLYYCGKININNKIKSLLFLYRYDMGANMSTFQISPLNKLIIYNFLKDRLCSVVVISNQLEKDDVSYTGLLSQKFNYFLLTYNYFTTYNNKNYCHYTTFYVDDIGFVRFQWFSFKEISKYFKR